MRDPDSRLVRTLRGQEGAALMMALLVSIIVFGLATLAVTVSIPETRVTANFQNSVQAKYFAESALEEVVGRQNDLKQSPRHLLKPSSYRLITPDSAMFLTNSAIAPMSGGNRTVGTISARIINASPLTTPAPYTIRATATLNDGSSTTYEASIDVISLLDFAIYSDADVAVGSNITIDGKMYSGGSIALYGPNINFLQRVQYVKRLVNASYGTFRQGSERVSALPKIKKLADLEFFEDASRKFGVCSTGIGLYIGMKGRSSVDKQTKKLFKISSSKCAGRSWCAAMDLTLFDFSASPITYDGVGLIGYDGKPLADFNGVIYSDVKETHVWGHLGGRSVEDGTVTDVVGYRKPPTRSVNLYSNNRLDPGEDGSNGGTVNGILDPRGVGTNLGIYAKEDIYLDHNIFTGVDSAGKPVRLALVAGRSLHIDRSSPKAIILETAVLARKGTWSPYGSSRTHKRNYWARNGGDGGPNTYKYDLDGDGKLEANTRVGWRSDRNEFNMRNAWTLRNEGNLVVSTRPNSGIWAAARHPRYYNYDTTLQTAEIPCYPTLPNYEIVPGSFTEVLTTP